MAYKFAYKLLIKISGFSNNKHLTCVVSCLYLVTSHNQITDNIIKIWFIRAKTPSILSRLIRLCFVYIYIKILVKLIPWNNVYILMRKRWVAKELCTFISSQPPSFTNNNVYHVEPKHIVYNIILLLARLRENDRLTKFRRLCDSSDEVMYLCSS